jgi:hypothetical protein
MRTLADLVAEQGLDYRDTERMEIVRHKSAVSRHADYSWAYNDKLVQKTIAAHIAVVANARAIPLTLSELQALDAVAVAHLAATPVKENQQGAAAAQRVGGLAAYYAALIYRAIRLGEDSCELAEELQVTPWGIRQTLWRLNQTAKKLQTGESVLRTNYRTRFPRRAGARHGARPKFDLQQAIPLRKAGLSLKAIGVKFNVTPQAVGKAFSLAGISLPGGQHRTHGPNMKNRKYNYSLVISLRADGLMLKEIAARIGSTSSNVCYILKKAGHAPGPVTNSVRALSRTAQAGTTRTKR